MKTVSILVWFETFFWNSIELSNYFGIIFDLEYVQFNVNITRMLTNAPDLRFIDVNVNAYKWVSICRDPAGFYIVSLKNEKNSEKWPMYR